MNESALELEPNAVLRGGPLTLGVGGRLHAVPNASKEFKLANGNRYEHFIATPHTVSDDEGRTLRVFEWVRCTYVAE